MYTCERSSANARGISNNSDEMVADAPHLEEVIDDFISFIGDDILLGHNITTYDTNLLYDELFSLRGKKLNNDYIDTLYLSQRGIDRCSIENYKLHTLCRYFDINTDHAHRALADCIMTHTVDSRQYVIEEQAVCKGKPSRGDILVSYFPCESI